MGGTEFEIGPKCESPRICGPLGKCSRAWEITKYIRDVEQGYSGGTNAVLPWMIEAAKCENPQVAEAIKAAQRLLKP